MSNALFRTKYQDRLRMPTEVKGESKTHQSFKKDADINNVLRKYQKTGQLPNMIKTNPKYGDFASVGDYQEALNTVLLANEMFLGLPSTVRQRFGNDPQAFVNFANDPRNGDELIKMGLASKPVPPPRKDDSAYKAAAVSADAAKTAGSAEPPAKSE